MKLLGHIAFGWIVMAAAAVVMAPLAVALKVGALTPWQAVVIAAYVAQLAWWLSRERRDSERYFGLDPHNVRDVFSRWNVFEWSLDSRRDLFGPAVVNGALAAVACYLLTFN